jgi:hypothetical protein
MAKKKEALPSVIFVVKRSEGPNDILLADADYDGFEDGELVGKYKLVSTGTMTTEHSLTSKTGKGA